MKFMRKNLVLTFVSIAILGMLFSCGEKVPALGSADEVLATVGEFTVTNADIQEEYDIVMNQEIARAKDSKMKITKEFLDQKKDEVIGYLLQNHINMKQFKAKAKELNFQPSESFATQSDNFTVFAENVASKEEFIAKYAEYNKMSKEKFAEFYNDNVFIQEFLYKELTKRGVKTASDEEAKAFYEENKAVFARPVTMDLQQILISYLPEGSEEEGISYDEAVAKMDGVLADLAKGADFEKVAKKNSENFNKETKGIIKGFSIQNTFGLSEENAQKIAALEEGQYSEMLEVKQYNFLLVVKVVKTYPARELTFDKVEDFVKFVYIQQQMENQEYFQVLQQEIMAVPYEILYGKNAEEAAPEATAETEAVDAEAEVEAETVVEAE